MQSLVQLVKSGAAGGETQEGPYACKACREMRLHGTEPSAMNNKPCQRCVRMELNCTGNGRSKRQRKEEPAHAGTRAGLQKVQTKTGARGTAEVGRRSVSSQRVTRAQQAEVLQSQGTVVLTEVGGRPDMEWEAEHMEEVARPLFGSDDEGLQLAYATTALTLMNLAESHRIDIHKVIQFRGGLHLHFDFCGVPYSGQEMIKAMERCIAKHEEESQEQRRERCVDSFQLVPSPSLSPHCDADTLDVAAYTSWVCGLSSGPPGSLLVYFSANVHQGADRQVWCNGPMSRLVATSAELCRATLQYRTSFTHIIARIVCPSSRERLYVRLAESMFETHVREKTTMVKLKCRGGKLLKCLASIRTTMHPKPGNMKMAVRFIPFADLVSFGHTWTDVPPEGCWEEEDQEDEDDMEEDKDKAPEERGQTGERCDVQPTSAVAPASGWSFISDGKETNPDVNQSAVREMLGKVGRSYAWGAGHLRSDREKEMEEEKEGQALRLREQWAMRACEATAPSGGNVVKDEDEACEASVSDVSMGPSEGAIQEVNTAQDGAHDPYGGIYDGGIYGSFAEDDDLMHVLDSLGPLF